MGLYEANLERFLNTTASGQYYVQDLDSYLYNSRKIMVKQTIIDKIQIFNIYFKNKLICYLSLLLFLLIFYNYHIYNK